MILVLQKRHPILEEKLKDPENTPTKVLNRIEWGNEKLYNNLGYFIYMQRR